MLRTSNKKWQNFRPICILMKSNPMENIYILLINNYNLAGANTKVFTETPLTDTFRQSMTKWNCTSVTDVITRLVMVLHWNDTLENFTKRVPSWYLLATYATTTQSTSLLWKGTLQTDIKQQAKWGINALSVNTLQLMSLPWKDMSPQCI